MALVILLVSVCGSRVSESYAIAGVDEFAGSWSCPLNAPPFTSEKYGHYFTREDTAKLRVPGGCACSHLSQNNPPPIYSADKWDSRFYATFLKRGISVLGDSLGGQFVELGLKPQLRSHNMTKNVPVQMYGASIRRPYGKPAVLILCSNFAHSSHVFHGVLESAVKTPKRDVYTYPHNPEWDAFYKSDRVLAYLRHHCKVAAAGGIPIFFREYSPARFNMDATGDTNHRDITPCVGSPEEAYSLHGSKYGNFQRAVVHSIERRAVQQVQKEGCQITVIPIFDLSFSIWDGYAGYTAKSNKNQNKTNPVNDCRHWNAYCQSNKYNNNGRGHTVPDAWARVFFAQLYYFHRNWTKMKDVPIQVDADETNFNLLEAHKKFVYYPSAS